jgi:phosphoadenosine phosphosulfate reductase
MIAKTIQQDLYGKSFEEVAISKIIQYEPPEGYYLAFSGGKDSIVIYDLAVRAGVKFDAHFTFTTLDPPEVLQFIRQNYPDVVWERPKKSMFQLIVKKGFPPTRNKRYCCGEIKEIHGKNRVVMTGLRKKESINRRDRTLFEQSTRNRKTWYLNPIIEWSDNDVWTYIRSHNLKYPCLYDEGYERIGCIMCPLQSIDGRKRDAMRYPRFYRAYLRAFKKMLENRPDHSTLNKEWITAQDVMDWWINER